MFQLYHTISMILKVLFLVIFLYFYVQSWNEMKPIERVAALWFAFGVIYLIGLLFSF